MSFPHYQQLDQMDCGPTCLRMIAKHYGRHFSAQTLREKAQISRDGVSFLGIAQAAESIGFRSVGVKLDIARLEEEAPLPCVLHWGQNHFVVLYAVKKEGSFLGSHLLSRIRGGKKPQLNLDRYADSYPNMSKESFERSQSFIKETFHIADPARGLLSYTREEFEHFWLARNDDGKREGLALLLEPTPQFYQEKEEKGGGLRFRQLLGYLWHYKSLVAQLAMSMLVGSGLSFVFPFLTQSVVDVGIETRDIPFIYMVLIGQMVLMCSSAAVEFIRSWILLHISTRLNLTILSDFLSKLMRLPVSFFDVKQFGDIMQRIGDHHRIESFLTGQTLNLMFSIFNLVIFGFVLAYYNFNIFAVAVTSSVLYTVWVILFLKKRRELDIKRFDVSSKNQSQIVQLIQGMQDIKLSGAEIPKRWEWERTQAKLFKWNVKSLSLSQVQQAGALLINQSKNIFVTFLAAKAVVDGDLTIGAMMSVQYIMGQFNAPVEQLIGFLQSWQDAQISLERLNEVHEIEDEEKGDEQRRQEWPGEQDIVIRDLFYTYPGAGNDPVLRNINFTIPHGKTTAIVGTSGSGKTTLLKILLRFYEPQSGNIYLTPRKDAILVKSNDSILANYTTPPTGLGLKYISHNAWRQKCGVVMQDGFIFSDTIARNIAVSDEIIDKNRLYQAAEMANIHEFIESLPLGYYTKIGAEGNGISQGQKQRILIARSVYKNPSLLLFDEATNALDANNEAIIVRNMESFFKERTVVVVAHRLSTVKNADQIVVMEDGKVVESGTHLSLVLLKGKYYELVSNQLELAD